VIGLLAVGAWGAAQIYPPTRAVRLRNAMLARRGSLRDFDWTPQNIPVVFRQEKARPYDRFREVVAALNLDSCGSDWERALRIAEHLTLLTRDLGPIQRDLETTYRQMTRGYGYCADFVKVFLGLAHAAGLHSRQWCFSFDGFGGHGHTFVEVFDRTANKWFFLDVHNNIHARNAATNVPLGALEFREALLLGSPVFRISSNGAGRLGFPIEAKLLAYFRRGLQEWYFICGNAVFSYEASPLVRWASTVSGPMGQIVASSLGEHPSIQVLATPENVERVDALMVLRRQFQIALLVCLALLVLLVMQMYIHGASPPMKAV